MYHLCFINFGMFRVLTLFRGFSLVLPSPVTEGQVETLGGFLTATCNALKGLLIYFQCVNTLITSCLTVVDSVLTALSPLDWSGVWSRAGIQLTFCVFYCWSMKQYFSLECINDILLYKYLFRFLFIFYNYIFFVLLSVFLLGKVSL